ncbi:hypothetical protein SDC9_185398 [bioreactor metagenome]|uniref:Uncharacterized protein n=1 Tax=bioreactor metagenome TaxID=1076179 RepID=A0A645HFR7_9ZZZZ
MIATLQEYLLTLTQKDITDKKKAFAFIKKEFEKIVYDMEKNVQATKERMENVFVFVEDTFGKEQEMLLVVTELTANYYSAKFIGKYGADKYFENNKELLFYERQQDIMKELSLLDGMML